MAEKKISAEVLEAARREMARAGGRARAQKLSKQELSEQGKKAAAARWAKRKKGGKS